MDLESLVKQINSINYKDCIGRSYKSNAYGDFTIIDYKNCDNVTIKFNKTGSILVCSAGNLRAGKVKDPLIPSICGVGVVGTLYSTMSKETGNKKRHTLQYQTWMSMIQRCYSEKFQIKSPSYRGCSVSDNFKYYEYFYEWCNKQIGFGNKGWHLDKDLLVKGNKVYSEDTCVFLPLELNGLLVSCRSARGIYPIGVTYSKEKRKFTSSLRTGGKGRKYTQLGYYKTPEEAFYAYKKAKEEYIKEQANKWKNQIDPRAYNALMNYEVEITD